jgi:hypothetical protein
MKFEILDQSKNMVAIRCNTCLKEFNWEFDYSEIVCVNLENFLKLESYYYEFKCNGDGTHSIAPEL